MRYYLGVDWADREHAVWAEDADGAPVAARAVPHTAAGLSEWGRQLDEWRQAGIELWAGIERPEGRLVEFLLDHGVVVVALNPKVVARTREQFRPSAAKSDPLDARVCAYCVRTRQHDIAPLHPSSAAMQELKLLTRDHQRLQRQHTRLLNQATLALKEYYPVVLDVFGDFGALAAQTFVRAYPTPIAAAGMRRTTWEKFARRHRLQADLWEQWQAPTLAVPAHVVRVKARLVLNLLEQLAVVARQLATSQGEIERFFVSLPVARQVATLPGSRSGVTLPSLWAEIGDAVQHWRSAEHLQAVGGTAPVTQQSGKMRVVHFRFACNKHLRHHAQLFAHTTLLHCEWARRYYRRQRDRGHGHQRALRALAGKWLKIFYVLLSRGVAYDEAVHLKTIGQQAMRQAA
jgi:transposase